MKRTLLSMILSSGVFFSLAQSVFVSVEDSIDSVSIVLYGKVNSHPFVNRTEGCDLPEGFEALLLKYPKPPEESDHFHKLDSWRFLARSFQFDIEMDYESHITKYSRPSKMDHTTYDFLFLIFEWNNKKVIRRYSRDCQNVFTLL